MTQIGIRQRDMSDCGPACLAYIGACHGFNISVAQIRQWCGTNAEGSSLAGLKKAAGKMGFESAAVKVTNEGLSSVALPAVAHLELNRSINHFVVLMKCSAGVVQIMEPAEGRLKTIPAAAFQKQWTGIMLLIEPGADFRRAKKRTNRQRLIMLFQSQKKALICAALCAIVFSVFSISVSLYIKHIVDDVLVTKNNALLFVLSVLMIGLLIAQFIVGLVKQRLTLKTSQSVDKSLVLGYYQHLLTLPQRFHDNMRTGELMSRVNDAVKINSFISEIAVNLLVDVLVIILSVLCMFIYNWRLATLLMLIIPVYILLVYSGNSINKKWQRKMMEATADVESEMIQSLNTISTIKKLGLEKLKAAGLKGKYDKLLYIARQSMIGHIYIHSLADLCTRLFTIVILWSGCLLVFNQSLTPGELLAFFALISYFTVPVISVIDANRNIREMGVTCDRLYEITELEREKTSGRKLPGSLKSIRFQDVSFSYSPGEPVLKNINIEIRANQITGITGESGSGKSTLLMLLLKLYEPDAGTIWIDEHEIANIDTVHLRKMIGCVPQESQLFNGTIRENILLDGIETKDKLTEILERTGIQEFCRDLAMGIDTVVTEQGGNLSGGQRQKISLARVLYRQPGVLVLDEPTASLDKISENLLMQTIEWYKNQGNTVIIISHSDIALKICDNIVTLNHGQVINNNPPL